MSVSVVRQFRQEQALQEQAAQHGLSELAMMTSHEAITTRMEIGAQRILKLFQEGKQEEAVTLMPTMEWC